jgi:hypothetical protein
VGAASRTPPLTEPGATDGSPVDTLHDALDAFERFMSSVTTSRADVFVPFFLALMLPSLATVIHEAGHALVARRFGVPIRAFIAAPEGPAITAGCWCSPPP